jgi:hypothetical protein
MALFSFNSFADDTHLKAVNEALGHNHCKKLNLTQDQMSSIKDEYLNFIITIIDHKSEMKKAKIHYLAELMNKDATVESLMGKADQYITAKTAKVTAKWELFTNILVNIMEYKQRKYGVLCLKKMDRKIKRYLKELMGYHHRHPRR